MIALELSVRTRVHPDRVWAPAAREIDGDHVRLGDAGVPGDLIAKIERLTGCREQCEAEKEGSLPKQRSHELVGGRCRTCRWLEFARHLLGNRRIRNCGSCRRHYSSARVVDLRRIDGTILLDGQVRGRLMRSILWRHDYL